MMSPSNTNILIFPTKFPSSPLNHPVHPQKTPFSWTNSITHHFHPQKMPFSWTDLPKMAIPQKKGIVFHRRIGYPGYSPYKYLSYAGKSIRPWPLRLNRSTSSRPSSLALRASRIVAAIACVDSGAGIIPSARANKIPALNVSS